MEWKKSHKPLTQKTVDDLAKRVHPSLRATFIPFPKDTETLSQELLDEIFGGDIGALCDVACLIFERDQSETNDIER